MTAHILNYCLENRVHYTAGLVAFSPLHVSNSYLVTTDIWAAIFTTIVLYFSIRILENGRLRDYLFSGLFVGLAIGSKYTAALSFLTILVAHVLWSQNRKTRFINKNILLSASVSVLSFFVTTPYSIFDYKAFLSDLAFESGHYRAGHAGAEAVGNHSWYLYGDAIISSTGLGYFAATLAILGIFFCFQQKNRKCLLLIAFPLLLLLFVGYYKVFFARNIVAAIPPLALLSAFALHTLFSKILKQTNKQTAYRAGSTIILFLLMAQPLFAESVRNTFTATLPDTRWLSIQWIKEHIPYGSKIAREQYTPPIEQFSNNFKVVNLGIAGAYNETPYIDGDYVILSSDDYGRYFDGTDRYAAQRKYYSDFFERHQMVYEIKSKSGVSTGPTIQIFSN